MRIQLKGMNDVGPTSISVWYVTPCDTYRHKGKICTTPKLKHRKKRRSQRAGKICTCLKVRMPSDMPRLDDAARPLSLIIQLTIQIVDTVGNMFQESILFNKFVAEYPDVGQDVEFLHVFTCYRFRSLQATAISRQCFGWWKGYELRT